MTVQLLQGDCLQTLRTLPSGSVQTCVTSPPYYGLRDYGHDGQIGLEETPDAYVAKLVEVFREVRRVLRDDGTLWCNLGDSYASSSKGSGGPSDKQLSNAGSRYDARKFNHGVKDKDLMGIPWLVAFALRADGWWLRSDIIWHKPNPMPESCRDRPTKAHEYIFLLSKSSKYFYDADAVREPVSETTVLRSMQGSGTAINAADSKIKRADKTMAMGGTKIREGRDFKADVANGRNRRSVWTVTTKPYRGAHFATFPMDLIEPCILAGTSAHGCCSECGAPWARVVEREAGLEWNTPKLQELAKTGKSTNGTGKSTLGVSGGSKGWAQYGSKFTATGWQPTCTCNADVVPCTVLDPFNGSGTTGAVAVKHGRNYIGCELNPDYIELAKERISKAQPELMPL